MKKRIMKLLAVLLAFSMALGMIPVPNGKGGTVGVVEAKAAVMTATQFINKMNEFKSVYKQDEYLNRANADGSGRIYHSDPWHQNNNHSGTCTGDCACYCGTYADNSWQCMAFALVLGEFLFGGDARSGGNWQKIQFPNASDICIGDIVRYPCAGYHHSVVIIDINGDTATVAECNYNGPCKLNYTRPISLSQLAQLVTNGAEEDRVYHYAGNDLKSLKSSDTTAPVVTKVNVEPNNITSLGFIVNATTSDNVGVTKLGIAVWTDNNGQDDLKWYYPDNLAYTYVPLSDHNNEYGTYRVDVYCWDAAGNQSACSGKNFTISKQTLAVPTTQTIKDGTYVIRTVEDWVLTGQSQSGWAALAKKFASGNTMQQLRFVYQGNGNYLIYPVAANGMVLDIYRDDNKNISAGCKVDTYAIGDNDAQLFKVVPLGNNQYAIMLASKPNYVIGGKHIYADTNFYLQDYTNMSASSKWTFLTTSGSVTNPCNHTWNSGSVTKAATCTAAGTKTYTCTSCNETKTDSIPALGHAYNSGTVTKAATCTADGVKTITCTRCNSSYTEAITKTGHTEVKDAAVAATCTATGKTEGSHCSKCNAIIKPQTATSALGHSYNSGVVTKAATCTADGVKTITCTRCNSSYTETITKTGHNYSSTFTIDVAATTTSEGSKSRHCTNAGCTAKTDVTVIPKTVIAPTGVTLNTTSKTLTAKGETLQLTATVAPSNATDKSVSWKSSNTGVATVDSTGKVTAVADGTATITCTTATGAKTATCAVTVAIYVPKNGLVKNTDGIYCYYVNDKIDTTKKGLALNSADNKWYYLVAGVNDKKYVGLIIYNNVWYYVSNGVYNTGYNGLTVYNTYAYSVKNGKLDNTGEGLKYCSEDANWYYLKSGKQDKTYTGLVAYSGSWWYVTNGMLDKTYKGLTKYNNVWYYVSDGKINKEYAGLTVYNGVAYSVKNGLLANTANGLTYCAEDKNWYYMKDGRTQTSVTGLITYNNDLWYVTAGKLDKTYKGLVEHADKLCYVKDGKLSKTNGIWHQDGDIYLIANGVVDTSVYALKYDNGTWYYFRAGIVDWDYNTLAYANDRWWYIRNGELDKTYTGLVSFGNKLWYVTNGELNKTYVGTCKYKGLTYNVKDGIGTKA